jgi:hypothetical protein
MSKREVEPFITLRHKSKPTVDIFTSTIARRLYISETMSHRAKVEHFVGRHRLTLGILKDEDIFLLKCVTSREHDLEDIINIVNNPEFDWNIVWTELEKQDKDSGNHVFDTIITNIDNLIARTNIDRPPFYKKLLLKTIDELICKTVRNRSVFEDELISSLEDSDVTAITISARIDNLCRLRLLKRRKTRIGRIILLPTKSNVLRYADYDPFYDPGYLIDHRGLIEKIDILSRKLCLTERYNRVAKEIADIVSCDSDFIANRIRNLAPAIIYLVVPSHGPYTRESIAITANVSKPSIT